MACKSCEEKRLARIRAMNAGARIQPRSSTTIYELKILPEMTREQAIGAINDFVALYNKNPFKYKVRVDNRAKITLDEVYSQIGASAFQI